MKRLLLSLSLLLATILSSAQSLSKLRHMNDYASINGIGIGRTLEGELYSFVLLTNYTDEPIEGNLLVREMGVDTTVVLPPMTQSTFLLPVALPFDEELLTTHHVVFRVHSELYHFNLFMTLWRNNGRKNYPY